MVGGRNGSRPGRERVREGRVLGGAHGGREEQTGEGESEGGESAGGCSWWEGGTDRGGRE